MATRKAKSDVMGFPTLTFQQWLQKFNRNNEGKDALKSLHALRIDTESKHLERLILSQCYLASQYDEKSDPNARLRIRDKNPNAIDRQPHLADAKINGLVFALTFIFRKWTSGAAADYLAMRAPFFINGQTMPRDGRPYAEQVKLFAKAALRNKVHITSVSRHLRNHPDIKFVGWPNEEN